MLSTAAGSGPEQGEEFWSNDKVRVAAWNVSLSTTDLPAAGRDLQVVKRRVGLGEGAQ